MIAVLRLDCCVQDPVAKLLDSCRFGSITTSNKVFSNPSQLISELQNLFPITDRKCLRDLAYYRRRLEEYYKVSRIHDSYFNLAPSKPALPLIPQDLNSKVQYLFPINLAIAKMNIREIAQILREHYHFKYIPNDFFKQKPKLLIDP